MIRFVSESARQLNRQISSASHRNFPAYKPKARDQTPSANAQTDNCFLPDLIFLYISQFSQNVGIIIENKTRINTFTIIRALFKFKSLESSLEI